MSIYDYESAFGVEDKTSSGMRKAIEEWFSLYYGEEGDGDPSQRIAYTVVNKIVKTMFGEYQVAADTEFAQMVARSVAPYRSRAMQMTLVGGECFLKPNITVDGFTFTLIPRNNILVFRRNALGEPVDVGTVEKSTFGKFYYTLLERRWVDDDGFLTIENRLYRSLNAQSLGGEVVLSDHPAYGNLAASYCYESQMGLGLITLKTPMLNCVDGSSDAVAVYAAATGLIRNIDRNEAQLNGEFSRGESRILVSADLLDGQKQLTDNVFVGLDEDPEQVGLTIFSPQLREQSYLARKQEYLRNVESVIGLKRGLLSDANVEERTATEIASSAADYNLTVMDFQRVWEEGLKKLVALCATLWELYGMGSAETGTISVDWGNGILYDEDTVWQGYMAMVEKGLLKPEIALAWRFNLPADTPEQQAQIRAKWMPANIVDESAMS